MDKKRRNMRSSKKVGSDKKKECVLNTVSKNVISYISSGICTRKFELLPEYGCGSIEYHYFDGLSIGFFDAQLKKDLNLDSSYFTNTLKLSYLIDGEQIIKVDGKIYDLTYGSQESYLVYISQTLGSTQYSKDKKVKEVKIIMSPHFIKKHKLNLEYLMHNKYALENLNKNFTKPICNQTQEILIDLLTNTRQGLSKRLFLESKALELLSIQLDLDPNAPIKNATSDTLIKKIYEVQFIINSDLSTQYSVHELARKVRLNDFMLKKEFKRVFNMTIFEYAINARMTKAKKLLKYGKKAIYEISELVGYKNSTHFTAAFKKIEGVTPKRYREKSLKKVF
ncbi:AraC family transcriptional regulator [Aquimarina sp. I32.4]|uniref:helix-turn-helix domain-containing protein n=1 Tax=Aquimarina sp. I32.4 TaxID=2053903 RepID=UPI000CDF01FB|nr:AraC family transcriptional regulator [Aquimarina sp. I32.4]